MTTTRGVLAFDHPTVSVTPTAKATWLADLVRGAGLTVDIIAHSRGGFVARMLTEQPSAVGLGPDSVDVRRLIMLPHRSRALCSPVPTG